MAASLLSVSCLVPSMAVTLHQALLVTDEGHGTLHQHSWETGLALWSLVASVPLCSLAAYHIAAITWGLPIAYAAYTNVKERKYEQREADGNTFAGCGRLFQIFRAPLLPSEGLEHVTATTQTMGSSDDEGDEGDEGDNVGDDVGNVGNEDKKGAVPV